MQVDKSMIGKFLIDANTEQSVLVMSIVDEETVAVAVVNTYCYEINSSELLTEPCCHDYETSGENRYCHECGFKMPKAPDYSEIIGTEEEWKIVWLLMGQHKCSYIALDCQSAGYPAVDQRHFNSVETLDKFMQMKYPEYKHISLKTGGLIGSYDSLQRYYSVAKVVQD